jgi:hypothetical protein
MFKCEYCGKEFEKSSQLGGHIIWCKKNPNRSGKTNFNNLSKNINGIRPQDIIRDDLFCQYCGKQCKNLNSLRQHEIRCNKNPNAYINYKSNTIGGGFKEYNNRIKNGEINVWNKGLNAHTSESVAKQSKALIEYYKDHDVYNKDTKMSFEEKLKRRIGAINYIKSTKAECKPRYNKNSIIYINELNKKMSWNLQHAENGGEIQIDGYFLDGYDKENNIAFEYNERSHYKDPFNNILKKKDIERNNYIKDKLKCKFYIYNEFTDCLYEY